MSPTRHVLTALSVFTLSIATLHAQTAATSTAPVGAATVTTQEINGEVLHVEGNTIVGKVLPSGEIRTFNIPPGQQFMIDGQPRLIQDLKPGTVLSATVITTTQPLTVRTVTVTNGTVWYVAAPTVILTLDNGQNRQYTVPNDYYFTVNGQKASVFDLRKGMKVSGARIVEAPMTEVSKNAVISGKAPK